MSRLSAPHKGRRKRGQSPARYEARRVVRVRTRDGIELRDESWSWSATQRPPWTVRGERRRANRVARRSRKRNR